MGRNPVRRRLALGAGLAALAAATLGACGFQLRRAPDFAFSSLYVSAALNSPLATELKRSIGASGQVAVLPEAQAAQAQVVLDIVDERREKVVVGLNATGQVREFQLRTRLRFRLRTTAGKELIAPTELLQQRDISFSESAVLSKEAEENLLYRDMQTDLVQQLMRRLAAVRMG
jgi:LPS-assembly lipoprotein